MARADSNINSKAHSKLPLTKLYISGGQQRSSLFRKLEEWQSSERALLIELDPNNNQSRTCVEYVSPPEVCADELPAILFKSASLHENKLYACTSTEVMIYEIPSFQLLHYISLPCFNDLHHVCPTARGTLLVAVTGLDMVVEISTSGDVVQEWSVLGENLWARFSRQTDYRKVATTKPHHAHPNHVFELEGEVWVTRLEQRDAICLSKPGPRIDIVIQRPHDGYVVGDRIYFTTVDGHVVIANRHSLQVEKTIDLNEMSDHPEQALGWCRGVLPVGERWLWAGFTRVRPTRFIENVAWIKNAGSQPKPSHIALYDLERRRCVQEIELEPHGIGVVFSLLPVPAGRTE
jgi:hypothetical protein